MLNRALRNSVFAIALCFQSGCGGAPHSKPLTASDPNEYALDRGDVVVHVGTMREVPVGQKRLDFGGLLEPKDVFAAIRQDRQADHVTASVTQVTAGVDVSGLSVASQTTKQTSSASGSNGTTTAQSAGITHDKDGDGSTSSQSTTGKTDGQTAATNEADSTLSRSTAASAPTTTLQRNVPSAAGLNASYHSVLYATAETVLAGQALQSLFNVDAIPENFLFVTVPVVLSVEPGRITRNNYIAETSLELNPAKDCGLESMHIVAVAPLGLTNFANDSNLLSAAMQLSASAGIPLGSVLADLKGGFTKEDLESLAQVSRRPEVQVAIDNDDRVTVRYLGNESVGGGVRLTPTTLNLELMLLVQKGAAFKRAGCKTALEATPSASPPQSVSPPKKDELPSASYLDGVFSAIERDRDNEKRTAAPVSDGQSSGWVVAALGASVASVFKPTESLSSGEWSPAKYSTSSRQIAPLHVYSKPPVRVTSISQGPGQDLVVSVADGSDAGWKLCVNVPAPLTPPAKAGEPAAVPAAPVPTSLLEGKDGIFESTAKPRSISSVRFHMKAPLTKDGFAYVAVRSKADLCDDPIKYRENWAIVPVKVTAPAPPPNDLKTIKLKAIQATLESTAVVVRLEYEAPLEQVTVYINGTKVAARFADVHREDGKKTGKPSGAVVYASLPQTLSRKVDLDRRVQVDVSADGYQTVSSEVRATW